MSAANGQRVRAPQPTDPPGGLGYDPNENGARTLIGQRPTAPAETDQPTDAPYLHSAVFGPLGPAALARLQAEQDTAQACEPTDTPAAPVPHWADQLRQWWIDTADCDISSSLDKIVEYGGSGAAYDLIATGRDLAAMNGRKDVTDSEAVELGILFYMSSKVNRWMAAVIDGRRPSDDTLLDIVYYGMMARRNRAAGGWPIA